MTDAGSQIVTLVRDHVKRGGIRGEAARKARRSAFSPLQRCGEALTGDLRGGPSACRCHRSPRHDCSSLVQYAWAKAGAPRQESASPASPTTNGKTSNTSPPAVAQLVTELCELGYIEQLPDLTDRRAKLVRFTPTGMREVKTGLAA
jgi:hypothetical protein